MKLTKAAAAVASAAVIAQTPALAQEIPSETWMGIYLGQAKVGYSRFFIDKAEFRGKPGYRLDSTSLTRLVLLGEQVEQNLDTTVYLNQEFEPIYQIFKMSSADHTTTITAGFYEKEIVAEIESEGTKSTKRIPVPPGGKLIGDNTFFPASLKLKVGDKMRFRWFNPLTLSLDDLDTEVQRQEEIELDGKTFKAFVIKSVTPMGEMTCWQDEKGDVLKVTALMGITMVREAKETAQSLSIPGVYTPPSDLAVMTAAPATTDIPDPRAVRYMKVRITGFADKSLVIADSRQKVSFPDEGKLTAEYEITASEFKPTADNAAVLPITDPKLQKLLADSPYVQPSNPEIAAVAKEIAGDEKNARVVVSKLRAWVNANMQSKGNIGIVRSSVDVLRAKTGVCRDYAVLYTALARAAGVPTKLVAGLVFWKGKFYYHAWAESFVGEWMPVDATLSTDIVDATHIKMAEGEATAMFDMVKTMGSLKAEILEFRTNAP